MADNITLNAGTGGANLATDDVAGAHYQKVKLALGAENAVDGMLDAGQQNMANSLPVVLPTDQSAIPVTVAGTVTLAEPISVDDNGVSLTVDGTVSVTQAAAAALNATVVGTRVHNGIQNNDALATLPAIARAVSPTGLGEGNIVGLSTDLQNSLRVVQVGAVSAIIANPTNSAGNVQVRTPLGQSCADDTADALKVLLTTAAGAPIANLPVLLTDGSETATVRSLVNGHALNVAVVDGLGDQITSFGGGAGGGGDGAIVDGESASIKASVIDNGAASTTALNAVAAALVDGSGVEVGVTNGALNVNVGMTVTDEFPFDIGGGEVVPVGFLAKDGVDAITENACGMARMDLSRRVLTRVVGSVDNQRLEVSATGRAQVDVAGAVTILDAVGGDSCMDTANNALRVNVVATVGGGGGGGDGAILDGVTATTKATVHDYTNSNPLAVALTATTTGDPVPTGSGTSTGALRVVLGTTQPLLTVGVSGPVDTELPAAAAVDDGVLIPAPVAPMVGAIPVMFDGTFWNRFRGTIADGLKVGGSRTHNTLPGAVNIGTLPAIATAGASAVTAGNQCALNVDSATGALRVTGAAGGVSHIDNVAFAGGSDDIVPIGAIFDATPPTIADGNAGVVRMNSARVLMVDGSAVTQPVSLPLNVTVDLNRISGSAITATNPLFTRIANAAGTQMADVTAANALKTEPAGAVGHGVAVSGNPLRIAGKANANEPLAVADGQTCDLWLDQQGRLVTAPNFPANTASAGVHGPVNLNVTATAEVIAAPGAGSIHVTGFWLSNNASTARKVSLREGTAGSVRYRGTLAATGGGVEKTNISPPWKLPATTALNVVLDAAGDVEVNVEFYVAP